MLSSTSNVVATNSACCLHIGRNTCNLGSLSYHSRYNNSNRRTRIRQDRQRDLRQFEDPLSSSDMAFLDPKVKTWRRWRFSYNLFTSQQYQKLKRVHEFKHRIYARMDKLPDWFDADSPKSMRVIFIRDMDEFLAGEVASIQVNLYRNWLQPNKIAVPASEENVKRWQHLNLERRSERDKLVSMQRLSSDVGDLRLEMKIRRDPNTNEVYSYITKQRLCRRLLLLKRITVQPEQIVIKRMAVSFLTRSGTSGESDEDEDALHAIKDAGSYLVQLQLDQEYAGKIQIEFRMNVRFNDIERTNRTPFSWLDEEKDSDSDEEQTSVSDAKPAKKVLNQEMRTELKKWRRGKQANLMLDHLVDGSSRYSALYPVSKLDLTLKSAESS